MSPLDLLPEIPKDAVRNALTHFASYGDGPTFVKHEGFAILNEQAFRIYKHKSDAEENHATMLMYRKQLDAIRALLKPT